MKRGTLARTMNKPIPTAEKFCAYEHCDRPERGTKFHFIEVGSRTQSLTRKSLGPKP
jgi:hypothetical protein